MSTKGKKVIDSLQGYIKWVGKRQSQDDAQSKVAFYRGHADKAYALLPGAYRKRKDDEGRNCSYRTMEYQLYNEMLRRNPAAFAEDQSVFERLVRMQHYGLPTRLLDFTENALVALFFACCSHAPENSDEGKEGEVFVCFRGRHEVTYASHVPGPMLAGVEQNLKLRELLERIAIELAVFFTQKAQEIGCIEDMPIKNGREEECIEGACIENVCTKCVYAEVAAIRQIVDDERQKIDAATQLDTLIKKVNEKTTCLLDKFGGRFDENSNRIKQLLGRDYFAFQEDQIKKYCSILLNIAYHSRWGSFESFVKYLVEPALIYGLNNNPRIRQQQGVFVLYPPMRDSDYDYFQQVLPTQSVIIKAEAKTKILDQLAQLGITHGYLFPELADQAKDIQHLFPPRADTAGSDAANDNI